MKGDRIRYRAGGYKYQLIDDYAVDTGIRGFAAETRYVGITPAGRVFIRAGYAWDGPSGPTIDTGSSLRGSLVHDALYQLMRLGLLPEDCRARADAILEEICVEDGMWRFRAALWRRCVRCFAAGCATPGTERPVLEAPP